MTGGRAAASLSLTLGIALATLLVGGGIVAGPAILDCAKTPDGFGACLRTKAADHGLLHGAPVPENTDPPRSTGWIEANATEYDTPAASSAVLLPNRGRIGAGGAAPASGELAANIDIGPVSGGLRAGGASSAIAPDVPLSLAGPNGQLNAAASSAETAEPSHVALGDRAGDLATSAAGPAPVAGAPPLALQGPGGNLGAGVSPDVPPAPVRIALDERTGSIASEAVPGVPPTSVPVLLAPGHRGIGASGGPPVPHPPLVANIAPDGGILSAAGAVPPRPPVAAAPEPLAPPPPMPAPLPRDWTTLKAAIPTDRVLEQIVVTPVKPLPEAVAPAPRRPAVNQAIALEPSPPATRPVPKYDPRFPNVIVLPPPNTGENSSFAWLEVR